MGEGTYKVNITDVPFAEGLRRDEGWIDMKVQFAIDAANGGAQTFTFGRTVMPPGAMHDWHRHDNAEEMQYLIEGEGVVLAEDGEWPVKPGDILFTPKGEWHGFKNTSPDTDAVLLWIWGGAGSRDVAGYEAYGQREGSPTE